MPLFDSIFSAPGRFYRGNLHTHSTHSDGVREPEAVASAYRQAGYDFLAMTDHFEERYGWPVTDLSNCCDEGFMTLPGAELHAPANSLGELWHILAVGLPLDFPPPRAGEKGPQLAARAAEAGAFVGIAHPACSGLSLEDVQALPAAHAIEIYNHNGAINIDRGDGWYLCEAALNVERRVAAYAADDSHFKTEDHFGGWVEVRAERLEATAILSALKSGQFYSSQGPKILDVRADGNDLEVECSPARTVMAVGRGARGAFQHGEEQTRFRLPLTKFRGGYLRVTVVDKNGKRAWTNPIWPT